MKKILFIVISLFTLFILNSCNNLKQELIITTYLEGTGDNQCIEIYNYSEKTVKLNNYSINIYGVKDDIKKSVKLSGKIEPNECCVIANSKANSEILDKANIISEELVFGGLEGIALVYKDEVIDSIGSVGKRNNMRDITYLRKVDMREPKKVFDIYDYIIYDKDYTKYLGVYENSVTPEELLDGPKFDKKYLENDFILKTEAASLMGGGGAVEVSLYKNVDGDTSYFIFPDYLDISSFVNPDNIIYTNGKPSTKVRYQDINTPETFTGGIEVWGWPAKLYTAKVQSEAKHIYVQSVLGDSLLCTYGRIMGYVFVETETDSLCVNFMIIKQGYSRVAVNTTMDLKYKDVPYYGYLSNAMLYAQRNGFGLHGDVLDPYWDYVNNKSIYA